MFRTARTAGLMAIAMLVASPCVAATTYQYDALGRVTNVTYDDGTQVAYTYDAAGNRTQVATVGGIGPWKIIVFPLNGFTLIPIRR